MSPAMVNVDADTFTVRIHPTSTPGGHQAISHLLQELIATEISYLGTTLRIIVEPIVAS